MQKLLYFCTQCVPKHKMGFCDLPVTMVASSLAYLVANSYSPSCTGKPFPHWAQTLPNPSCWIRPNLFCGSMRLLMISVRTSAAAPFRVSEGLDSKVKSNGMNLQQEDSRLESRETVRCNFSHDVETISMASQSINGPFETSGLLRDHAITTQVEILDIHNCLR